MPILVDGTTVRIARPRRRPRRVIRLVGRSTKVIRPLRHSDRAVVVRGPRGPQGAGAEAPIFEYQMPVAQTTAIIDHPLSHDPVAVQVLVDGQQVDEYSVVFTVPNEQVRVGFDISVAALVRML